ncbi:hypothetical protein SVAN01_06169 [Stagonosporopsis vannaccii]|nr:hypothetical protein SVAN01_06169 [Stagonosporopsis vannaccii]
MRGARRYHGQPSAYDAIFLRFPAKQLQRQSQNARTVHPNDQESARGLRLSPTTQSDRHPQHDLGTKYKPQNAVYVIEARWTLRLALGSACRPTCTVRMHVRYDYKSRRMLDLDLRSP